MPYRPKIKNADGSLTDLPLEAETTVKLKTSRSIGLSGVTATAQSFNGTSAITIPITSIPASLLTGTGAISITGNAATATKATSADMVVKDSGGSYQSLTLDTANKMLLGGSTRVVQSKTPLYVGTIGTYSEDYTILSGNTFPTIGKFYEVIYEKGGMIRTFRFKMPSSGNSTSSNWYYFSLRYGPWANSSTMDITEESSNQNLTYDTFQYIRWKFDFTAKTVKQTYLSGGYGAAQSVYFKGIYELHEELGK